MKAVHGIGKGNSVMWITYDGMKVPVVGPHRGPPRLCCAGHDTGKRLTDGASSGTVQPMRSTRVGCGAF